MQIRVKQGIEKMMDFVTITVHPKNTVDLDVSETGVKTLLNTALIETENIRKHLVGSLFNLQEQNELESLVQNYQSVIIRLLDDLYAFKLKAKNKDLIRLYTSISSFLSDILSYLETYFSKYFNVNEKIPHTCYTTITKDFELRISKLKLQLKDKPADQEVIRIIFLTFEKLNEDRDKNPLTYRKLVYLKEFLNELDLVSSNLNVNVKVLDVEIQHLLIILNFNHPAFIIHSIDKILQEVNVLETQQEKILKLKFLRKGLNQVNCMPGVALHKDTTSVKDQLVTWIDEEIIFLQSESNALKQTIADDQKNSNEIKINTSLSVPQLAYFIRLLVENKTITNINQTEILKFISLNFSSLKRENISYIHLRSQYYKPELPIVESIKSLLLALVNLSRKIK